ncbi:hypothetical protein [Streptosporangium saharense]|uniref:hypothetical protein n=1 Tax=Streptosporangium saharense TaxID=1706840 RepID=UPI00331E4153
MGEAARHEGQVVAGPGGVMTDEVGVVTGDLTVVTEADGDAARVTVQYTGADEWYVLTGSPIPLKDRTVEQVHQAVLDAAEAGHEGGVTADEAR